MNIPIYVDKCDENGNYKKVEDSGIGFNETDFARTLPVNVGGLKYIIIICVWR